MDLEAARASSLQGPGTKSSNRKRQVAGFLWPVPPEEPSSSPPVGRPTGSAAGRGRASWAISPSAAWPGFRTRAEMATVGVRPRAWAAASWIWTDRRSRTHAATNSLGAKTLSAPSSSSAWRGLIQTWNRPGLRVFCSTESVLDQGHVVMVSPLILDEGFAQFGIRQATTRKGYNFSTAYPAVIHELSWKTACCRAFGVNLVKAR